MDRVVPKHVPKLAPSKPKEKRVLMPRRGAVALVRCEPIAHHHHEEVVEERVGVDSRMALQVEQGLKTALTAAFKGTTQSTPAEVETSAETSQSRGHAAALSVKAREHERNA